MASLLRALISEPASPTPPSPSTPTASLPRKSSSNAYQNELQHAVQSRLNNAIRAHERAQAEVERLCDILEKAAEALKKARHAKKVAQKELDDAARSASKFGHGGVGNGGMDGSAVIADRGDFRGDDRESEKEDEEEYDGDYEEDDNDEDYYDDEGDEDDEEIDENDDEHDEEEKGFDMGNEALDQIRYRLELAKIDPHSPDGEKLLDELLLRLQQSTETNIDASLVNQFIDELFFGSNKPYESETEAPPQSSNKQNKKFPKVRIYRGGKVLGWYRGQLDERGYARQGKGSMYYEAGHECHGSWKNDEMTGYGVYKWSDGHVYDGEWCNGKRHGPGRFIRPDGVILYGKYDKGHHKGVGVRWSKDRQEAQMVVDGVPKKTVGLEKAEDIARKLGFDDVPPAPYRNEV